MEDKEDVCITVFDGPTVGARLEPRTHIPEPGGQAEPDGTQLIILSQPPATPGAMRVVAFASPFMHATLTTAPADAKPDAARREFEFTLVITGRLTEDGWQAAVRRETTINTSER